MRGKITLDSATPSQATALVHKEHFDDAPDSVYNGSYYNDKPTDTVPVFLQYTNYPNNGVPTTATHWLLKHRIDYEVAVKYDIGWSQNYQRIIFPLKATNMTDVLDKGWNATYGWIGRNVSKEVTKDNPKWLKRVRVVGESMHFHAIGKYRNANAEITCVVVEDVVSAIRVAEGAGCHAVALLGTTLPKGMLARFKKLHLVVWLDADAYTKGLAMWSNMNKLGYMCKHLYTDNDPKTYSNDKIREHLELV
jgi:hypothetical protein